MGEVIDLNVKRKEKEEREKQIERIGERLDKVNGLMGEVKRYAANEERLAKERKENNEKVLRNYRIRRKK